MDPILGAALINSGSNVLAKAATAPAQNAGPSRADAYGGTASAFDVNSPAFGSFAVGFGSGAVSAVSTPSMNATTGEGGMMGFAYIGAGLVALLIVAKFAFK